MKNGTVQSRVKINEGEQYIVNLSKSRRRICMVWLYYLISERTCCVFCKIFRNGQCPAHYLSYHMCVCWNLRHIKYITLTMTYPNANFNPSRYFISFAWYKQQRLKNFKVKMQNRANLRVVWLRQNGWIFRKFPNFQCTTSLGVLHQQYYFHGLDKKIRPLF